MASVAELNVVIGARIKALQDGLKDAERSLRKSGAQMSRLGSDITSSLSLPLALAGGAAISAAGDIEALTLALKSQLGTSEAAAKELGLLTEAAKNPGLGVEQAVRGSVRLQGVGFAAEEARKVLVQMGNAIASTGGSAQELDNVTRQFAQMTSKGRVLQEDVSILSENMPGLAQLMQKAFGTQSVEAIRNMGVSGKEFVLQITKAAEALPRVEGGIKNSIGNALDSLKQSAAKVGFAINSAFNVTGAIESLSAFVLKIADGFSNLDPALQKVILGVASLSIAIGPLISGFGGLFRYGEFVFGGLSKLTGVIGGVIGGVFRLSESVSGAAYALGRFNLALGVIGVVVALGVAVYTLSDNFDAAEFAAGKFADAQKEIISQTSSEIGEVNKLFAAVKDETKSKFEKGQSIDKLLKLYPDYFRGMDLEGASVSRLTQLQNGLNSSILRGVAERKKAEAVNSIYEKQAAILTRITQIREGGAVTASEASLINTGDMIRAGSIAEAVMQKMGMQAKDLTTQIGLVEGQFDRTFGTIGAVMDPAIAKTYESRDAYQAEKEAHEQGLTVTKEDTKERKLNQDQIDAQVKRTKALKEVLDDVANSVVKAKLLGEDEDIAKLEALRKGIEKLIDAGFKPASDAVKDLKAQLDKITQAPKPVTIDTIAPIPGITPVASQSAVSPGSTPPPILEVAPKLTEAQKAFERYAESLKYAEEVQESLNNGTFKFSTGLSEVINKLIEQGDVMGSVFAAMGDSIAQAASAGETSFLKLGQAAAGAAAKIVRAYIQQAVAAAVAKAIGSSIPFPFNLAAGAAAGGIAAALFTSAIGKIGIKGFAAGTRDAPGGLALVGERGPEILNLPRHSQVLNAGTTSTMLRNSQASMNLTGEFVIKGTDLVLTLNRVQNKDRRYQ